MLGKQASTESLLVSKSSIGRAVTFVTRVKDGFKIFLDLPVRQRKEWMFPWVT